MTGAAENGSWRARLSRRDLLRTTAILAVAPPLIASSSDVIRLSPELNAWRGGTTAGLTRWVRKQLEVFEEAIAELTSVTGARTIANTLEPYDRARNALAMAANQMQVLASVAATSDVRDAARTSLEKVGATTTRLDLDPSVYGALLALSESGDARRADAATRRYIAQALMRGRLAGADRDDATRVTVKRLQTRISELGARYTVNMYRSVAIVETTVGALKGLPADFLARHPADPNGVVKLTTAYIDVGPVMRFASDPDLRRRMHVASENQAFPANAAVLAELVSVRAELARAIGYKSYADLALSDQMAASADEAQALLDRIEALSRTTAGEEAAEVRAYAKGVDPTAVVTSADAAYWSERYRRERFGIDEQELRAYLPFRSVLPGIVAFVEAFFRVRFEPVREEVAWHPQVIVFDVHDASPGSLGRLLGRIYIDAHPREGKDQIFATAPLVPGIGDRQLPEGVILCNLPGGDPRDAGLLSHLDVVNLLHEFGHLIHHILGGAGRWSGQGAFDTEEDFLEAPSQMLEEFSRDASVLKGFARHHVTGASLPDEMIDRLNRSAAFGRAGWLRAQLQRAQLALAIHRSASDENAIEAADQQSRALLSYEPVEDTHPYAASPHLVGYGPNYYMYLLDKVIAVDMAIQFPKDDASEGNVADRYRRMLLEPGASRSARTLVSDFLGRRESDQVLSAWMRGVSGRH